MMPSLPQLLIVILVVALLFGTNKLRNLGSDLGKSLKDFKKALNDEPTDNGHASADNSADRNGDGKSGGNKE
ncbi:hypothetical protein FACS1894206_00310 [Deltaproteobacteria bacterium]|nr:hypothetical protein FACS1894206_00310 [Deltaproteobacteria bacterium]